MTVFPEVPLLEIFFQKSHKTFQSVVNYFFFVSCFPGWPWTCNVSRCQLYIQDSPLLLFLGYLSNTTLPNVYVAEELNPGRCVSQISIQLQHYSAIIHICMYMQTAIECPYQLVSTSLQFFNFKLWWFLKTATNRIIKLPGYITSDYLPQSTLHPSTELSAYLWSLLFYS